MESNDENDLRLQMAKTTSFIRGALAVAAILFGAVQYYALRELKGIDEHHVQIAKLERQVSVMEVKLTFLVNKAKAELEAVPKAPAR